MKQYTYLLVLIGLFALMLFFPQETFIGAQKGLLLWFQIILPTLLPFLIVSNVLIHTNAVSYISRVLSPALKRLFRVSDHGSYAVLIGFLCGYPMGAKTIADLRTTGRISQKEGQYLLSFCNNTSLMFIVSFIVMQNFQDESLMFGTLLILWVSPFLCSLIFRRYYNIRPVPLPTHDTKGPVFRFHFTILDNCIMNGFETITKIGGYMMLFSILFTLGELLPIRLLLPILEISNGIPLIASSGLPFHVVFPYVLGVTAFGGLCAAMQTYSVIRHAGLAFLPYITQKLITAMVTSLLALIYILLIHP